MFPSPGDLPSPGIEPTSAWQADSLPLSYLGSPKGHNIFHYIYINGYLLKTATNTVVVVVVFTILLDKYFSVLKKRAVE